MHVTTRAAADVLRPLGLAVALAAGALAAGPAHAAPPGAHGYAPMLEGAARFVAGDLDGADAAFARAAAGPTAVAAELGRLLTALARGDAAAAAAAYARGLKAGGDEPLLHYWAAVLELRRGRVAAALGPLERAETLGGDRPPFLILRAVILHALGRAGAAAALGTAAAKDPELDDPRLFPDAGRGVIHAVERALRDYPNPERLRGAVAQLYLQARLYREAEDAAGRLLVGRRGDPDALLVAGRARNAMGDAAGALELLDRAVATAPGIAAVHAARAEALLALGRGADAERELERAVDLDPRDAASLGRLAARLWERGELARAEELWGYALRRDPRLAAAHYGMAQVHERAKRLPQAEGAFREAAALEPTNPRYLEALAMFLERQHRAREAAPMRARARAAVALQRELQRRQQASMATIAALGRAAGRARARDEAGVRAALKGVRVPAAARAYLEAYLAAREGRSAAGLAARALAGLPGPRDFAAGDLTLLQVEGRIDPSPAARRARLTVFLPGVNPERLR